jgi:C4-dicarboxylate transporter DctQ subunit
LNKVKKVIQFLGLLLDRITRLSWLFTGALITLMAIITGYGVAMRYLFKNPDPWAYELTYILMLLCVVFSVAHTQRLGRHLRIDIMDRYFPEAVREIILNIIAPIAGLIFCIPLIWKSWDKALFALQSGEVSSITRIPIFPMMLTIPIGIGLLCLVFIAQILRYLASLRGKGRTVK